MRTTEKKTFFVYSQGTSPRVLTLGSLVLEDYVNPTLTRHYCHPPLTGKTLENAATVTPIKDFLFYKDMGLQLGPNIDVAEIAKAGIGWKRRRESILHSPIGKKIELIKPEEFLNNVILADPTSEAHQALQLWLTAGSSEYYTHGKFFRTPDIWMLTGYYILENARVLDVESADYNLNAEISSAIVTAVSGVPVGGGFTIGKDLQLKVGMLVEEAHVWAAQYQKLDAEYVRVTGETTASAATNQFPLLDTFSKGQVRA
ncbi:uncharacterized protein K441DRAFT_564506 [Cenococcum geophilum 1.58]|uniref:uncharacterized protein n=1 Tax=Cenococcum geophilum 1.58 TaxID=794803 RepID=UPI00358F8627|nr:hypothetical protein K441DRAFT_564506 [Cenococcum geophilum 1.58]